MTEAEIKELIKGCLEMGRISMWKDLDKAGAVGEGGGWDQDMLESMYPVDEAAVEEVYKELQI